VSTPLVRRNAKNPLARTRLTLLPQRRAQPTELRPDRGRAEGRFALRLRRLRAHILYPARRRRPRCL